MDTQTEEKNRLILTIKGLYKEINKISNTYLQYDDINLSQRTILEDLLNGSLTVPQIAKKQGVSRQHIQTNVNNLLQKGFVVSQLNSAHKRSKLISITASGEELFNEIAAFENSLLTDLFNSISEKQIEITNTSLENMKLNATAISEAIK